MRRMGVLLVAVALVAQVACGGGEDEGSGDGESSGSSGSSLTADAGALVDDCRASDEDGGSGVCADLPGFEELCAALDPSLSPDGILILPDGAPEPATVECRGDDTIVHVAFLSDGAPRPCDGAADCTEVVGDIEVGTAEHGFVFVGDDVYVDVIGEDVAALATSVASAAFGIDVDL